MSDNTEREPQEFCKIALLIPVDADHPRPDKWNWQVLLDHPTPVAVLACEYVGEDELPATADFTPAADEHFMGVWDAATERFIDPRTNEEAYT